MSPCWSLGQRHGRGKDAGSRFWNIHTVAKDASKYLTEISYIYCK